MEEKPNLFGMARDALGRVVSSLEQPAYRANQLFRWLYQKRVRSLSSMSDLPLAFREALARDHSLAWPEVAERDHSGDGTVKYLFRLGDGGSGAQPRSGGSPRGPSDGIHSRREPPDAATIESVFIPEERRRTICISTQAGCPLKCTFCLTGIGGYRRNLRAWEILGQVATVMQDFEDPPGRARAWNVVVMGMGEPLLNYEATTEALRVLMDPEGFAVAPKKLTLSTVGILPALERLMHEPVRPNLAISLHAPNEALRRRLMPIEAKYPLRDVVAAAGRYPIPRGGRVTYEYVLLKGVNDSPSHARELARLLEGSRAKVNLIPLNAAPEIPFETPTAEAVDAFCGILAEAHLTVSVRRPRGRDILAACGQLHLRREAGAVTPVAS